MPFQAPTLARSSIALLGYICSALSSLSNHLAVNIRYRRTLFPKAFTEKCSFVACSLRSPLRVFLDLRSRFHDVPAHMRLLLLASITRASRNPSCKRPSLQLRARHPTSPYHFAPALGPTPLLGAGEELTALHLRTLLKVLFQWDHNLVHG
jgi:hypothetical protein